MINKKINNLCIYQFENLLQYKDIFHFVTTRNNGISTGSFKSLNLGFKSGDDIKNIEYNWKILKENLGLKNSKILTLNQIHSDNIIIVDYKSAAYLKYKPNGDAIITNQRDLCIVVLIADCVPIILYDPVKTVISVIHAGWRGTSLEIAKKTVEEMSKKFSSRAKDIIVGIGPSIGACCFEVKNDVVQYFIEYQEAIIQKNDSYYIDLQAINMLQLIKIGVNKNNIEISNICTSCNHDIFFSYRQENPTGRFATGIMIK